jgi:Na+-transporting NADH:ubiquinone oxidoreductase subunit NqrC
METKKVKTTMKTYASSLLKVALGAGTVIGGAYVFSRLKEKQDADVRLERMEQILEVMKPEEK